MGKSNSIYLTTYELASCLALCGYESMATQVINSMEMVGGDEEIKRFIQQTEISLKSKGYWDEERSTMLVAGLEDLLHLLVQSKKKIRCIKEDQVLFIHLINANNLLIQHINNQLHSFRIQKLDDGVTNLLLKHFRLDEIVSEPTDNLQTLLLSDRMFDELHILDPDVLEEMIKGEKLEKELKQFFYDFKRNYQEFDNLSFMEMDYVRDYMDIKHVFFMLPSEKYLWHLDYDKVREGEIYIVPTNVNNYIIKLNQAIFDFFLQGDSVNV